jgi:two-component system, OmpR family, sensor histidine kinase TctE
LSQNVCAEWVANALKKNIDLGFSCALKTAEVQGNEVLLRELINNLIDNAIRYTPKGGKITVGVKEEKLTLVFYVQDSGIGISSEDQTRIFERFYRVLGTQQDGCGLGLTIVQEIAERHGASNFSSKYLMQNALRSQQFVNFTNQFIILHWLAKEGIHANFFG